MYDVSFFGEHLILLDQLSIDLAIVIELNLPMQSPL